MAKKSGSRGKKTMQKGPPLSPKALEMVARRFKALGQPVRLRLIQALLDGEMTVQDLCEQTETGQANASKHLGTLATEGILARRKEGLFTFYRVADPMVFKLCDLVCASLADRFEASRNEFTIG